MLKVVFTLCLQMWHCKLWGLQNHKIRHDAHNLILAHSLRILEVIISLYAEMSYKITWLGVFSNLLALVNQTINLFICSNAVMNLTSLSNCSRITIFYDLFIPCPKLHLMTSHSKVPIFPIVSKFTTSF